MPSTTAFVPHVPVERQEVRNVTAHLPKGDVQGYEVRFLVRDETGTEAWTAWLFFSPQSIESHLASILRHLQEQGHLAGKQTPAPPLQ